VFSLAIFDETLEMKPIGHFLWPIFSEPNDEAGKTLLFDILQQLKLSA